MLTYNFDPPTFNPNYDNTIHYKNTCEGILELKEIVNVSAFISKEEFLYEGKNECINFENENLNIQIYPNPSSGYFDIYSSIFQSGDTRIIVYSMDGKVLLQKTERSRSASSAIDLSFLQNGFHILQLRNGDHFVKSKIVIAK